MSKAAAVYKGLPAVERQEFRLPALLKEHLGRAAAQSGQSVAEYVTTALAERVSEDLAGSMEWSLSVDEQAMLVKILVSSRPPSDRARETAERADTLFGHLSESTAR